MFSDYLELAPSCPDCETAFKVFVVRLQNHYQWLRKEAVRKTREPSKACGKCEKRLAEKGVNLVLVQKELCETENFNTLLSLPVSVAQQKLSVAFSETTSDSESTKTSPTPQRPPGKRRIDFGLVPREEENTPPRSDSAHSLQRKFPRVWSAIPSEGPSQCSPRKTLPEIPELISSSSYFSAILNNLQKLEEAEMLEKLKQFSEELAFLVFRNSRKSKLMYCNA